jgi:(p)ppGpp synthase/HD superfamily hydrolase
MLNIRETEALVRQAFEGQVDSQNVPMADHMARVVGYLPADADEFTKQTAWLHDLVEDTKWTLEDLAEIGYPPEVTDALFLLTHVKKEMKYPEYIQRICDSGNVRALQVKIADQTDNLTPSRQLGMNRFMANALRKKWAGVKPKLEAALAQTR